MTDTLDGGDYVDVSIDYTPANSSLADFGELIVIANDAGAGVDSATGIPNPADPTVPVSSHGVVQEYTRSNNIARIAVTGQFTAFSLAGSVDKTSYTANDIVTITATPTNLGSFPTTPVVRVSIVDSAGNVIEQFADTTTDLRVAITNIGNPPVNSANVLNTWQTGQTPIGNYTAHIELIHQDKVVAELDRAFAIVADGALSAQTNSQLYVDKTQYLPTDMVQIHSRVMNTASNAMAGQRDVTLTVTDPNGQNIWTQDYSYNELAPNAIKDQYFNVPLADAITGSYTVTSTAIAADGTQANQALTQSFTVLSAAQTGFGVAGTLAGTSEITVGETVNWQWSIDNSSDEPLNDLPLSIALFIGESLEPFQTLTLSSTSIDASGTLSGVSPWISSGVDGERITAVLLAEFAQGQKGLAQSQVLLTEPPINVTIGDNDNIDNTLLVYYNCVPGWNVYSYKFSHGNHKQDCFEQRASVLERYLKRIDVPYKLVSRPEKFANEMQSGKYAQYWLLGAVKPLHPYTRRELVELAYSGDNLLIDSAMNGSVDQKFYSLAGVKRRGALRLNSDTLAFSDQFVTAPTDDMIANTALRMTGRPKAHHGSWAQHLTLIDPNKAEVWATVSNDYSGGHNKKGHKRHYQSTDYPAIVGQRYGNGTPIATNFDVIGSLDLATSAEISPYPNSNSTTNAQELHWDNVLTQLLNSRRQIVKTDYVPNEVVRLPVDIENTSNKDRHILVKVDLPAGSQWLGYNGGMDDVVKDNDTVNYQITVTAGQSIHDVLTIRLPQNSGTHPVRLTVSDVTNGSNNSVLLEEFETRYLVRDIESRIQILHDTIHQWSLWSRNGKLKIHAKAQLGLVYKHHKIGLHHLAVYEAARLGETLSRLQEDDTSSELEQLRYELDELLRALQIELYLSRNQYDPHA